MLERYITEELKEYENQILGAEEKNWRKVNWNITIELSMKMLVILTSYMKIETDWIGLRCWIVRFIGWRQLHKTYFNEILWFDPGRKTSNYKKSFTAKAKNISEWCF